MTSTFNLLTAGGAKFNRKRFANDFELFERKKTRKGKEKEHSVDVPSSLDYFNSTAHSHPSRDAESDSEESKTTPQPPRQKITLTGSNPLPKSLHSNLPSLVTHSSCPLPASSGNPLLAALAQANIHSLWGVQCAVAGSLLEGRDTMCIAPTGSGKTLSYLLPTLVRLRDPARALRERKDAVGGIRALVVVPTHDLAVQIHSVAKAITRGRAWRIIVLSKATEKAVIDSAPGEQAKGDRSEGAFDEASESSEEDDQQPSPLGIDLLIATPERLHHLIESRTLDLSFTRQVILDEADRLFSEDFRPQVEPILQATNPPQCLKTFLAATIPSGSEALAKRWMKDDYVRVVVGIKDSAVLTVDQSLLYTASEPGKLLALRQLLSSGSLPYPSLIFVQSVQRADELYRSLVLDNVDQCGLDLRVGVVHGDKSVKARDDAIQGFREGKVWVLVVTEVLARGMDFRGVKVVVNYDFPQTTQSYIHRIGRTGRAGRPGKAITFFTDLDAPHLRTIANVLRASGCQVPEWMLELRKPDKNAKKRIAKVPIKRGKVGEGGRDVGREKAKKKRDMVQASKRRKMEQKHTATATATAT